MKKKFMFLIFALFLFPLILVGCSNNPPEEVPPETELTYTASIKMNDSSRGHLSIDNLKSEYEPGEIINITVSPKEGYYLRGYSDTNEITFTRQIIVNDNVNIVVNLEEGESCNFYGYRIARNCSTSFKGLGNKQGNTTTFLKYKNFANISSGSLVLNVYDTSTFGAFVLRNSSTKQIVSTFSSTKTITEADMQSMFGEPKENEWIDIIEYDTRIGNAFYTRGYGESWPSACNVSVDKFDVENFDSANWFYYYLENNNVITCNFTKQSNTEFYANITRENGYMISIQSFNLFKIDSEIYYFTSNSVAKTIDKNDSLKYTENIDDIDYIAEFYYV